MTAYHHDLTQLKFKADAGDAWAQSALAYAYETGQHGLAVDHRQALHWYQMSALQGYAYAQDCLGLLYVKGRGVKQDFAEALKWFLLAAQQGNASAAGNAGIMYLRGYGVKFDYDEARKWFGQGAHAGDTSSQVGLGEMSERGWGASKNMTEAIKWYGQAALLGNKAAIKRLEAISPATLKELNIVEGEKWKRDETPDRSTANDREKPPPRE